MRLIAMRQHLLEAGMGGMVTLVCPLEWLGVHMVCCLDMGILIMGIRIHIRKCSRIPRMDIRIRIRSIHMPRMDIIRIRIRTRR